VKLHVEDHKDPLAELRRLLVLHRAYEMAGRADELLASQRPAEAGALYLRAAELAPDSDELLFWAGLALAHTGDFDTGVDAVRRAIEKHAGWGVLLDRLTPTFAPAGEQVRRALGRPG
jgi:tetratricopeptide (TPR) repeat protein